MTSSTSTQDTYRQPERPASTAALNRLFAPGSPSESSPRNAEAWHDLAQAGDRRGLCGLILEQSERRGLKIPTEIREHLQVGTARVIAEQLHMTHHTVRLLRAFDAFEVPVMLLKGMALTHCLYDAPGLRPMSDVDLLVRSADVDRTVELLRKNGCRRGSALVRDDFFPRFYYESEWLTAGERPVRLDVHVRPWRPLRTSVTVPEDGLWHNARRINAGGAIAWIPAPERMFIHLAAHAAYHGCTRLIWLYDLRRWFERYGATTNWTEVEFLCRQWRLTAPVRRAIQACRARVGNICPADFADALSRHPVSWRDRLVLRQAPRDAERPLRHVLVNAVTTPSLGLALGYAGACLSPDDSHLGAIYAPRHPGWRLCAHALRGIRAVGRAMPGLGRLPRLTATS